MTRLLLIRHAVTDWNETGRLQGHSDISLNAFGIAQAQEFAQSLSKRKPAAIYSSDLKRAFLTAQFLAEAFGLTIKKDPRLREVCFGVWEGLRADEIRLKYPGELERREEFPSTAGPSGGETVTEAASRLIPAIKEIVSKHEDGEVLVVSHGIAIRVIELSFSGQNLDQAFTLIPGSCEIRKLELDPDIQLS